MNEQTILMKAIEMTVLDAIENGADNPEQIAKYMETETFDNSVQRYKEMIEKEFKQ